MASDLINGCLEMIGALLLAHNCRLLYQHKRIQGVSVLTTGFFTLWGAWNLYFYPVNALWFSFAGGVCLAITNLTWVVLAIYYSKKSKSPPSPHLQRTHREISVSDPASVLDRIKVARGVSSAPNPLAEENRRREATLREACYRTYSVETRPWVTNVLNVEDCRRLMAERRRKDAEAENTNSSSK